LRDAGWLVTWADDSVASFTFADLPDPDGIDLYLLDMTNPGARAFLWGEVERLNYDVGVRAFWVDACEPELTAPPDTDREEVTRFHRGHGAAVSSLFPVETVRAFRDGLDAIGDDETVLMVRSSWAGSQRLGAIVWSGDTLSSWQSLREQVRAGLNMMASGMPWWNADIGGFIGADIEDEGFRELLVRWFQYAVFTPVVRLHGLRRRDWTSAAITESGADNEIWSFGPRVEGILTGLLHFRERLRPYVAEQLRVAAGGGPPPMRPLWFSHPHDAEAVGVEDAYLFGPDLLAAPITEPGARERRVYVPAGSDWIEPMSERRHEGGSWITLAAPLDVTPFLVRHGSTLGIDRGWFGAP
jgi:alpha-D-xyloside xylohydrolase